MEDFISQKIDAKDERILIMGAGNTVMADEGAGPRALELLMNNYEFPDNVTLMDVGTTGLLIINYLREADRVIVLDAAQNTGHEAGTVVLFKPDELADNQVMHSAHDLRLIDVLKAAALRDVLPKSLAVVGVQVADLRPWVLELSEPVEAAIPLMVDATLDLLGNLNVSYTKKEPTS